MYQSFLLGTLPFVIYLSCMHSSHEACCQLFDTAIFNFICCVFFFFFFFFLTFDMSLSSLLKKEQVWTRCRRSIHPKLFHFEWNVICLLAGGGKTMPSKSPGDWHPLSNEEKTRHEALFFSQGPIEGLLPGKWNTSTSLQEVKKCTPVLATWLSLICLKNH